MSSSIHKIPPEMEGGGGGPRSLTIPPTIQSTTVYSLRNGTACSIK